MKHANTYMSSVHDTVTQVLNNINKVFVTWCGSQEENYVQKERGGRDETGGGVAEHRLNPEWSCESGQSQINLQYHCLTVWGREEI